MDSRRDHWRETFRVGRVLARWHARVFRRTLFYHIRHTFAGMIGAVGVITMAAILTAIAVGGYLETLPASEHGLDGLLLVTHLWLAVSLSLMLICQFAKVFIKQRNEEPLVAHPALFPALARHRVFASIPFASFAFTMLFFTYFWQPLAVRLSRLWLSIPIHLSTIGLLLIPTAVVMGGVGRKLLRIVTKRGLRNPDLFVNATGGISIFAFGVLLLGIVIVNDKAVSVLEALGNSVAVSVPIGMIPFAAALAADEGRWMVAIAWLGLSAALTVWSARVAYRWSFSAHREIPIDLTTPVKRVFAPVFTGRPGRWLPAGLSVFWRKDVVVPYSREPKRYLFHQVNLLWWGIMTVILAMALRNRGSISPAFADTIPVLMTLFAMAILAMQNGVNALGREGKELTWLRPVFTGSQLFGRKLLVNLAYVLIHGVVYAFVVSAASRATSLGTSFSTLAVYAVSAGTVFACLATAVGFLLPDFERKRSSLPGSTAVGKGGYLVGVLILISITGAAHLLLVAGIFDGATYAGLVSFAGICALVVFALISASAIRLYQGMEI